MKINNSCFIYALALLLLNNAISLSSATTSLNSTTDQQALIAFKNSISSDTNAILAKNWSTNSSICSWIGISCTAKHQRVTTLNISSFNLSGTITPHIGNLTFLTYLDISSNNFTGLLPSEISHLHRLKVINVGFNLFTGEIPSWIGNLPQLHQLHMKNNSFSGIIPPSLFNNSKLQSLDLTYNFLDGSIPDIFNLSSMTEFLVEGNKLSGELPNDMCNNVPNIKTLSLSRNQLGGEIPTNIHECRSLERLSLSFNHFHGSIPSEIARLSMLRMLWLGVNDFEGKIPMEIGNLSRLEILSIPGASLTGNIPSSIFNISLLRFVDLSNNSLSGGIPIESFHSRSKIQRLFLNRNHLSGSIDSILFESKSLISLVLTSNRFTGFIPNQLGNVTSLKYLYLDNNNFTGELPKELANLASLEFLTVRNNSLTGSIPSPMFNISTLKILDLSTNQFSGNLPSDIGNLPGFNIEQLFLYYNTLSGPIPNSISNASKLTILDMNSNSFSGSIPDFGNLRDLYFLDFWGNNLTGAEYPDQELKFLSSLTNCRNLGVLDISFNPLNGILPASIGNLSTSLRIFRAFNSNINGVIPSGIGSLSGLQYLHLSGNKFTGSIPTTIGKLKQLQRIHLADNLLQGHISHYVCEMSSLGELDLSENMLIGSIPECLGELKSLRNVFLSSNKLNSTIPSNLWNLGDLAALNLSSNYLSGQISSQIKSLKSMNELDLSSNQFSGDIPISIDGCQSLEILSFSNNKLEGSIPESLGNIKGLIALDLSNNSLSGLIPNSLEGLQFLRYLNVSYNRLEGEIPTKGPFVNLTAKSFLQNSALCGDQTRFQVPHCIKIDLRRSRSKNFVKLIKYILPPFISVAFLVIIIILFFARRRKVNETPSPANAVELGIAWRRVSHRELVKGTNAFSEETNLLGKGSYGKVFKGTLSDNLTVAVKVFDSKSERAVKSFDTESEILSSIRHRNLVRIIGCCSNTEFKALILDYMPNGSLEKWLYYPERYCLDLMQRLKIAVDVALALEYLHHGHTFPIVHCDIKPSNILLDEDMNAHVGDFGISKLFDQGEDVVRTKTIATIGYAAPEYGTEGKVSMKGDVYSYGILLLEMFTRKRPTDDMFGGEMSLKEWVSKALQEDAVSEIVDPCLLEGEDEHFNAKEECISSVFHLAMKCLAFSPHERIDMVEAVAVLMKIKARVVY